MRGWEVDVGWDGTYNAIEDEVEHKEELDELDTLR